MEDNSLITLIWEELDDRKTERRMIDRRRKQPTLYICTYV